MAKKAKKSPNPVGRPPIEINWDEFEKLMHIQATAEECAGWFDCSIDTLENKIYEKYGYNFSEYKNQKGAKGKISLRRKQFQVALSGNVPMMIFLGKNQLNQSDKLDQNTTAKHEVNVVDFGMWDLKDPNVD